MTNASEEGLTELAGILFDTIFMDELSTYSLTVQGYLSLGKSQAEAEKLARQELFSRLGESALSGALMGVLFGGGASADSYFRSRMAAQGEARMRSGQLPTDAELEAMNLSESEALGQMVLLQMEVSDVSVDGDFANQSARNSFDTVETLDAFLESPQKLAGASEHDVYNYLVKTGYDVQPLSRGSYKGIPFEDGGGFKVNWGGDRILQYHPANSSHHGGAYFKISSGVTGTIRIDLAGNIID